MIANITYAKECFPLIEYNEKKVKKGEAERLFYSGFDINADKYTVANHFDIHSKASNRVDKNMHISLNFAIDDSDKISEEFLIKISKEYLTKLGFDETHPFIVYQHFDSYQPHVHIVTPKIIKGKTVWNDSNSYYISQKITRELEKKYKLREVNSIKSKVKEIPKNIKLDGSYLDFKDACKKYTYAVDYVLRNYNPTNFDELKTQLSFVGVKLIEVENESKTGQKFQVCSIEGNNKPINLSKLYNRVTQKKLQIKFNNSLDIRIQRHNEIEKYINTLKKKYITIDHSTFEKELSKINLKVEFTTKNNEISAYRFFDTEENIYYKPSGISRGLSYGSMKPFFGTNVRNYQYHNKTILFVLDKKFKEINPTIVINNEPQVYIDFMVRNGFVPDVYNGELRFNHYLNKNPKETDFIKSKLSIPLSKINFKKISDVVNDRSYKRNVWLWQQEDKQMKADSDKNVKDEHLLEKSLDYLMSLFTERKIFQSKKAASVKNNMK